VIESAPTPDAHKKLSHVVITRFNYRDVPNAAGNRGISPWIVTDDPLNPRRLEFRLAVFEITCAASLLGQTRQDFDWVLIVDRALPERYCSALSHLLRGRPRTHVHVYNPNEDLGSIDWLQRYVAADCAQLLTTQLDDDDALPANYIQELRARIDARTSEDGEVLTAASLLTTQWELVSSARSPLGRRCAWHRGKWPVSTGLSLLSPARERGLTVLALNHQIADVWTCTAQGDKLRSKLFARWGMHGPRAREMAGFVAGQLAQFQSRVRMLTGKGIPADGSGFIDLSEKVGAVLVTNHFMNDQFLRLLEPKLDRVRVDGPESFPNVPLRIDRFREEVRLFKKNWSSYVRLMRVTAPRIPRWRARVRLLLWASRRFVSV
jgi:hypothetical protein